MDIKKGIKKIFKVLEWLIFLILIIILFLVASPLLPTKEYISTHVVSTGSMEPKIKTGSIVLSSLEIDEINKGDIIVFTSPTNEEITIVHRVMQIEKEEYITKGDNNDNEDDWIVFKSNIKGKVFFTIPYLGYAIQWMKTPIGFITIIIVPALLFILTMIKKIKEGINEEVDKRTKEEISKQNNPPILAILILISTTVLLSNTSKVYALFSSTVQITGITLTVGEKQERIPEVIINEVMWSGTSKSLDDQWIELRNTTNQEVDIGKWKIEYSRDINKPPIMIPANRVIPANGYFVISNYSNESNNSILNIEVDMSNASMNLLPSNNGNLVLKDAYGEIVDQALGETQWAKGEVIQVEDTTYHSMQRNGEYNYGLNPDSWNTCKSVSCNDHLYWKSEYTLNFGTPGSPNAN